MDYKEKLVEFYKIHNPEKLALVDSILQSYAGREEQLLMDLQVKYGLREPPETASPAPPVAQNEDGLAKYTKNFTDSVNDISANISGLLSNKDMPRDKKGVTIVLPSQEATTALRRLETENEQLRQDIKRLLDDKTLQQSSLDVATSTRKKLERQVTSLARDLHEKSVQLGEAQEEKGVLVCKCDNMASDVADLIAINHRLAAQVTHLAAHIVLQPTPTVSSTDIFPADASERPDDVVCHPSSSVECNDSQIASLKAIVQASNVEMSILNHRLLSTERQLAASHKHATLLESRLQESTTQLEQLTEKYESLSRYHTNDKMELDDIMLRLNERSVAAAEGEEEVKRLRQQIEQVQKTKDDAIRACNDTIKSIEKAHEEKMTAFVENVMMQHEEAFSYVSEVAQRERDLQAELLDAAQGRIDQLQVELFRVRRLVSHRDHEIMDLRDRLDALEKK